MDAARWRPRPRRGPAGRGGARGARGDRADAADRRDGADVLAAPARHLAQGPPGGRALAADRLRGLGPAGLAAAAGARGRRVDRGGRLAPGRRRPRRQRADGGAGQGGAGRLPAPSEAAGRGVRTGGARRCCAADPQLAAWPPPRPVEPARRRHRARRGARATPWCARWPRRPGWRARSATIVTVDNTTLRGTAPSGRDEELHSVGIVYDATVPPDAEPRVVEVDGTTDAAAWVRAGRRRVGRDACLRHGACGALAARLRQ